MGFFGRPNPMEKDAAQALGWVSLALGATELLAAKRIDKFLGTGRGENAGVIRALGVREVMHGVDLLAHPEDPAPGVWARVAGDALDGALLCAAAAKTRKLGGVLAAFALVTPVVAADVFLAGKLSRGH
jgi:hypothetical protein